jgi:hypothetical protein
MRERAFGKCPTVNVVIFAVARGQALACTLANPEAAPDQCVAQSASAYGICSLTSKFACHYAIIPRFSCSSPMRESTHFSQAPAACMQTKEARP